MALRLWLCTDHWAHFLGLFYVFGRVSSRQRYCMKRKTLFYTNCVATASNNISSLHFACSHTFFSETKYCYSQTDVRSQLVPSSAISRSWTWKSANLPTLKIHKKISYNEDLFAVRIRGKWNLYWWKKIVAVSGTLNGFLVTFRDGPLEKWWEGVGKKQKKSCKGKCQEKKFVQRRR